MNRETELIKFINKCDQNLHLVKHDGNYYHTTQDMYNKGIKVCNSCGKFMPLEKIHCKCGEEVYVFFELPKEQQLKINAIIAKADQPKNAKLKGSKPTEKFKFIGLNKETLRTQDITGLMSYEQAIMWSTGYGKEKANQTYINIKRVNTSRNAYKKKEVKNDTRI